MPHLSIPSPLGDLTLFEEEGALVALDWGWVIDGTETPLLLRAQQQLADYFDGRLTAFSLPFRPAGTLFQQKVWQSLLAIPHGQVTTYGALADSVRSAPRAVGGACGRNPLPILIPCHRVVAADGSLGGYSGLDGISTKQFLLRLEGLARD